MILLTKWEKGVNMIKELKYEYVWYDVFKLIKDYKKFLSFDKTKFKFIIRKLIGIE